MTDRSGRVAASGRRDAGRAAALARARAAAAVAADAGLAALILLSGVLAWAPRIGLAAARETLAARRDARAQLAAIGGDRSDVWARQARRNALARQRHAAPYCRPAVDP